MNTRPPSSASLPSISYEGSLLLTLEEISNLISHSYDPAQTLSNIVCLVQSRFRVAVCSVYLYDSATRELVLSANVGLNPECIGRVRMKSDEGLTGLVAETMASVSVSDAFTHPRFKFFPEIGEELYHSFLGVPLVDSGYLQGVLVVQTADPREFTSSEVRMLITVASQVASLVADAALLEQMALAAHADVVLVPEELPRPTSAALAGSGFSRGVGQGQAYILADDETWRRNLPRDASDPHHQRERLAQAIDRARHELTRLSQHISDLVGEDHGAILQAQLLIMQDRSIEKDLHQRIDAGSSAEGALMATQDHFVSIFQKVATSGLLQERVNDLKDVFHRVLWQLQPRPDTGPTGERVVLIAREPSVLQLFAVDLERLAGVVLERGGPQSHAAILARSLSIPMVGLVADFELLLTPGCQIRIDGTAGEVLLNPTADAPDLDDPAAEMNEPITLAPGLPRIEVNLNLLVESVQAVQLGAPGAGLYRSEFLFLARRTLPTEEEQVNIYRRLLRQMDGRPVSIRTFDLRPDKLAQYAHLGTLARSLDWRLVLDSPTLQQLFREQVRAILRAGVEGPVRLLIPLVTQTELLDFVVVVLEESRRMLREEGLEIAENVPLGVMIETAAAVPLVRSWAEAVTWFAIGTNDLTASALDLDRDDPLAMSLADPLHPGLLRLIDQVIREAHSMGKPVTVCGEMAADPAGTLVLAALGVDSLSVAVPQYLRTRRTLSAVARHELDALAPQLLECRSARDVRRLLARWL